MRLVVKLDPGIKAVLTHLVPGDCRLPGDLFTGRYVGNGSAPDITPLKLNTRFRSEAEVHHSTSKVIRNCIVGIGDEVGFTRKGSKIDRLESRSCPNKSLVYISHFRS